MITQAEGRAILRGLVDHMAAHELPTPLLVEFGPVVRIHVAGRVLTPWLETAGDPVVSNDGTDVVLSAPFELGARTALVQSTFATCDEVAS